MNMLSFYGGPAGKDFTIAKIFDSKASLDADIAAGDASEIYAGDYVLVSYGDPNTPEFSTNRQKDGDKSYNATLWKKDWNNGYEYRLICSIASSYPLFSAGAAEASLKFGSAPQLTIDSSSLANPKVGLKMPASLKAGIANTTESVAPTATASIVPVYGGSLGNELSFQAKIPQGVTFTPSVSDAGEISWTNNGNLPNPATKSVKGQKGDTGVSFAGIEYTPSTASGGNNTFKVKYSNGTTGTESYNIKNGVDITSVEEITSDIDGGTNSITFVKSDGTKVGPVTVKNGSKGSTGTIKSVTATVDANMGTPQVTAKVEGDRSNADITFEFKNIKGPKGDGGTVEITSVVIDNGSSEIAPPSVEVISGTTDPQHAKYSLSFHNLVGKRGAQGPRGYYFLPSVATNGDLSWSNNSGGELANPTTINIRGPQGEVGNPLNIIATETITSAQVSEDTLAAVGAELTARGRDPQAGELIAVSYEKAENDVISYWYFKVNATWQRVQLSGGMGGAIVNTKVTDATASSKVYSAEYINALEARLAVLENALTIGEIGKIGGN